MIKCKNCGELNTFDRILCISCAKKLDFENSTIENNSEKNINVPKIRIKLQQNSFFDSLIKYFLIFIIFLILFMFFYTSHINKPDLKISDLQNLEKKLKFFLNNQQSNYININNNELNVYFEKYFMNLNDQIQTIFPKFFKFQKCFAEINDIDLSIHIEFLLYKKNIIFSFIGIPIVKANKLLFEIDKTMVGKLIIPKKLILNISDKILKIIEKTDFFKIVDNIDSIKTKNRELVIFSKNNLADSKNILNSESNTPDDLLLIQSGDSFFIRKNFNLANKYYRMAINKFPNSPFRDHLIKQLKICQEKLQNG